jgi:rhodanese-related sulfurtransferase
MFHGVFLIYIVICVTTDLIKNVVELCTTTIGGLMMTTPVTEIKAADSIEALAHFEARLRFETDCWDVNASARNNADFVLLDVRGRQSYNKAHVPGAIDLAHGKITARKMAQWPADTTFVVYCAGPHCNGANKAAVKLARLGLKVKEMIGGMTGWADEGFEFAHGHADAAE